MGHSGLAASAEHKERTGEGPDVSRVGRLVVVTSFAAGAKESDFDLGGSLEVVLSKSTHGFLHHLQSLDGCGQ